MKSIIPATTTPLTKFIRTTEGWFVLGSNIALIVVPIITTSLPAKTAVALGVGLNAVTVVSRSILKAVSSLSPLVGGPINPNLAGDSSSAPTTAELEQGPSPEDLGESTADVSVLDESGTPDDKITSAGAADKPVGGNQ